MKKKYKWHVMSMVAKTMCKFTDYTYLSEYTGKTLLHLFLHHYCHVTYHITTYP